VKSVSGRAFVCATLALLASCSLSSSPKEGGGARGRSTPLDTPDNPDNAVLDANLPVETDGDDFFIDDPAPAMCGPNGKRTEAAQAKNETINCPEDKNRRGCPCEHPGEKAACWPGKRVNRNHGRCKDGTTTCRMDTEFDARWGPCEGYVLPDENATEGADACRCFSSGQWVLSNLVPCIFTDDDANVRVTSSIPDADKGFRCLSETEPSTDWTSSTLTAECAGQFQLCYTLKAGNADHPQPDDCMLMRLCIDTWYPEAGKQQKLQNLPGWASEDSKCSKRFVEQGGYGEMSVLGLSSECDAVDDGHGDPHVFKRTRYCSTRCAMTPNDPDCKVCGTGGSGQF
jgi:hypothetical protein